MSAEKGETKKKKGLTWAEAAKQVNSNFDVDVQRRSTAAFVNFSSANFTFLMLP